MRAAESPQPFGANGPSAVATHGISDTRFQAARRAFPAVLTAAAGGKVYKQQSSTTLFRALDAEHIELADEIPEDDRAVAWASSSSANGAFQDGIESSQLGFVLSLQCGNIV
jgi:hypothetical protein